MLPRVRCKAPCRNWRPHLKMNPKTPRSGKSVRRDCWSAREQQLKMWWGGKEESCSASPLSPPSIIRRSYLVFGGGDVLLDQLSPFLLLTPSSSRSSVDLRSRSTRAHPLPDPPAKRLLESHSQIMSLKYEEVAKHNKVRTPDPPILVSQVANSFFPLFTLQDDDCWVIVHGVAWDVTEVSIICGLLI